MSALTRVMFFLLVCVPFIFGAPNPPQTIVFSPAGLASIKERVMAGDPAYVPALSNLVRDAEGGLRFKPVSVVEKTNLPPSGDPRDYYSLAPYHWPDPTKSNGLPYVNRDGVFNPDRDMVPDAMYMRRMSRFAETLALAWYFTGDGRYGVQAARLLRVWFLDPATAMHPHLKYAQAIRGLNEGRASGIVDTQCLLSVVDAAALLQDHSAWSKGDQGGMASWFSNYARWLVDSPAGQLESRNQNNHGTWYDAQLSAFALFGGLTNLARETLARVPERRMEPQIQADGSMPLEYARSRSWHYTLFSLAAFFTVARIGDGLGLDLWNQGNLRKAFDRVAPFGDPEKKWPWPQIDGRTDMNLPEMLRNAALVWKEPAYEVLRLKCPDTEGPGGRYRLLPARSLTEKKE